MNKNVNITFIKSIELKYHDPCLLVHHVLVDKFWHNRNCQSPWRCFEYWLNLFVLHSNNILPIHLQHVMFR